MTETSVEPFYERLGARIHRLRQRIGMTAETLATKFVPRVTRQHVSNIEGGRTRVLAHQVVTLARALGVSTDELLTGKT